MRNRKRTVFVSFAYAEGFGNRILTGPRRELTIRDYDDIARLQQLILEKDPTLEKVIILHWRVVKS